MYKLVTLFKLVKLSFYELIVCTSQSSKPRSAGTCIGMCTLMMTGATINIRRAKTFINI